MSAEAELNTLKKLESNKTCINCEAYNKFGHGNICEKFKTFVCSNCKSAHQSFSMRVKSVTMSNWTKEEVDALKEENGGGNAVARRVWLGRWDEAKLRKPREGDHIDVYKRFIDKVYNDKLFYDEDGARSTSTRASNSSSSQATTSVPASSSASAAAANLLDFSAPSASFDAFGSSSSSSAAPKSSDGWGDFAAAAPAPASNDGFGAFASAPSSSSSTSASFDPFGMSSSTSSAAAAPIASSSSGGVASFDPFGPSSAHAPSSAPTPSFDPFGPSAMNHNAAAVPPAPMASGFAMNAPPPAMGGNFSAFDALSGPPQGQGMGYGMGMGMHSMGMNAGGMARGPPPHMMNNMGMGMGMGMMGGGNAAMNISSYMAPPQAAAGYGGRPNGGSSSSRDPFAGLGLPGK